MDAFAFLWGNGLWSPYSKELSLFQVAILYHLGFSINALVILSGRSALITSWSTADTDSDQNVTQYAAITNSSGIAYTPYYLNDIGGGISGGTWNTAATGSSGSEYRFSFNMWLTGSIMVEINSGESRTHCAEEGQYCKISHFLLFVLSGPSRQPRHAHEIHCPWPLHNANLNIYSCIAAKAANKKSNSEAEAKFSGYF